MILWLASFTSYAESHRDPICFYAKRRVTLECSYRRRESQTWVLGRFLIEPGPGREETPRLHLGHVLEALLRVVSAHFRQRAHLVRVRARARVRVRVGVRVRVSSERTSTNGG